MVRILALVVACAVLVRTAPLAAQAAPPDAAAAAEARSLFERGVELARQERWPEAEQAFRASSLLVARPSVLYNLALALFEVGRASEALAVLADLMAASDPVADARHRENAAALRERALASLAVLDLRIEPAAATVRVDGEPLPGEGTLRTLPLDAGVHAIDVSADGHTPSRLDLVVAAGERVARTVALAPLAPPPAPAIAPEPEPRDLAPSRPSATSEAPAGRDEATWPTSAWILVAAGAAVLAGSLVTGVLADDADDEFVAECGGTTACDPALRAKRDEAARLALATDILLATGSAAVLSGIGIVLLHDPDAVGDERPTGAALRIAHRF